MYTLTPTRHVPSQAMALTVSTRPPTPQWTASPRTARHIKPQTCPRPKHQRKQVVEQRHCRRRQDLHHHRPPSLSTRLAVVQRASSRMTLSVGFCDEGESVISPTTQCSPFSWHHFGQTWPVRGASSTRHCVSETPQWVGCGQPLFWGALNRCGCSCWSTVASVKHGHTHTHTHMPTHTHTHTHAHTHTHTHTGARQ
jgi:hypothetical protein